MNHTTSVDYRHAQTGESPEFARDFGPGGCCSGTPLDQLLAVTFDTVTFLVCGSCAADAFNESLRVGASVSVEPFLSWVWS